MNTELVNIIFGMKIRQARLEADLTLSEFAQCCDLSPSYITEIEKGRKYPKTDKILKMAEVLNKSYDELVSIKLAPPMQHLENILSSPLLQQFPFEAFDLEASTLVNLFTRAPAKASVLLHTILEIGRQHDIKHEHLLRAALRSFQELQENYFQDIEEAATEVAAKYGLANNLPLDSGSLRAIVEQDFQYQIDESQLSTNADLSFYRSVYLNRRQPRLFLNPNLEANQKKFLIARELGYQILNLKERANTSTAEQVDSFEQVLNGFKASYFAGALLIPQPAILKDLKNFFQQPFWSPASLFAALKKYDITPEMLLYRLSELLPRFFGIRLHFHRFYKTNGGFKLVKQLNMNGLLSPSGIALHEHHCRRWLALRLLQELPDTAGHQQPKVGVQISEYHKTGDRFLSFGFARHLALAPEVGSSIVLGFEITPELGETIRFLNDPDIQVYAINDTCERCPFSLDECSVRAAEPVMLYAEQEIARRKVALAELATSSG